MKLTEAKLKQLINEVLEEGMKTIADLPSGVCISVMRTSEETIDVFYSDDQGNTLSYVSNFEPYGVISMDMETQMSDEFPCMNAYMVAYSDAVKGWGPLLYDICIEVATIKAGGLVSDRTIVSPEAYKVWDIYNTSRGDVEKIQLDDEIGTLTPDIEEDDCLQSIAIAYSTGKLKDKTPKGTKWNETPLSKLYRKEPTRLDELNKSDRLITNIDI
tara:strand:- start:7 stop:651 length:645 start_codon:yes stop_codon:yes gene_type:complete